MSGIVFTTNEDVDKINHGQKDVGIIGYVDKVVPVERVGFLGRVLKKFLINNGTGKQVPCLVWGSFINTFAKDVKVNKIVHLKTVTALRRHVKNFDFGNTPIELIIGKYSTVEILGDYETDDAIENENESEDSSSEDWTSSEVSELEHEIDNNDSTMEIRGTRLFDEYQSAFFRSCNSDNAGTGTFWIVKLTKSNCGKRDMIIAGRNDFENRCHVDAIFVKWYERIVEERSSTMAVRFHIGRGLHEQYTPCATCARILKTWLKEYKDVKLTIYFAFVYTWLGKRTPESEFVGRLQELRNLPNRTVNIRKINIDVIKNLAEYLGIQFKGYPWYDNYLLENQIITDSS